MSPELDIGVPLTRLDEAWIDVGDEDRSGRPDPVRHPGRDSTAAAADLEAVPTWSDAGRLQEAEGSEVVERVEAREAFRGLGLGGVVEDVGRHGLGAPRRMRTGARLRVHLLFAALRSMTRAISPI